MEHRPFIAWKRNWLQGNYQFFEGEQQVGELRFSLWSSKARGSLFGNTFFFQTRGFFRQITEITGSVQPVGRIVYDSWGTKATLETGCGSYSWKSTSPWYMRWMIRNGLHSPVESKGKKVIRNTPDDPDEAWLILAGFFISRYLNHLTMMIIIIPVIVVLIAST